MHYEITNAIPDIIHNGIWIKEYQNYHGKVPGIVHIIASVKIKNQVYAIKLTIKKQNVLYKIGSVKYTKFNAYDVETKNEPVIGSTSADSRSKEVTPPQPIPITDSTLSVRDFLKNVNDKESSSRMRGILFHEFLVFLSRPFILCGVNVSSMQLPCHARCSYVALTFTSSFCILISKIAVSF